MKTYHGSLFLVFLASFAGTLALRAENEYENAPISYSLSDPHDAAQARIPGDFRGDHGGLAPDQRC